MKTLNDLSLAQEGLEQQIRLLDHPACSPDLNRIENLCGLIVEIFYEECRQYSAISELINAILDA